MLKYSILFILFFDFGILTSEKTISQLDDNITINGEDHPDPGAQEYYEASFNYSVNSQATLTWSVTGGTIISESTNPTSTVWCIVEWDNEVGQGYLSLYDDIASTMGEKNLDIGCATANAASDVTICYAGSSIIGTTGIAGYTYSWYPTTGLSNANIAQPIAGPTQTTTYTLTVSPENLFTNGDFESGFTGFSTDYGTYPNGNSCGVSGSHGSVGVSTNPNLLGSQWCNRPDHTTGTGKMLVVDGSCTANSVVWSETVTVGTNTTYYFSGWCGSNYYDFQNSSYIPNLRVRINGTDVIQNFSVPWGTLGCGQWYQFSTTWNSGSATSAVIEIINDNLNDAANDFSLDDIYFANCPVTTDQVTVTVAPSTVSISPAGPITYYNQYETINYVTLTSSPAPSYQWYKNNISIPGATSQTYTIEMQGYLNYTDYYKCISSCGTSNTVTFNYVGCMYPSEYPVTVPGLYCVSNLPLTLTAPNLGTGTSYSWWTSNTPTGYSFSNFSTNSCQINATNPYHTEGIYTKSSRNGQETYMFYIIVGDAGCRIRNPNLTSTFDKTMVLPNPAKDFTIVKSTEPILYIEVYNSSGNLVQKIKGGNSATQKIYFSNYSNGFYNLVIAIKSGLINRKLIVQK